MKITYSKYTRCKLTCNNDKFRFYLSHDINSSDEDMDFYLTNLDNLTFSRNEKFLEFMTEVWLFPKIKERNEELEYYVKLYGKAPKELNEIKYTKGRIFI